MSKVSKAASGVTAVAVGRQLAHKNAAIVRIKIKINNNHLKRRIPSLITKKTANAGSIHVVFICVPGTTN
jgi:hypothetical protein